MSLMHDLPLTAAAIRGARTRWGCGALAALPLGLAFGCLAPASAMNRWVSHHYPLRIDDVVIIVGGIAMLVLTAWFVTKLVGTFIPERVEPLVTLRTRPADVVWLVGTPARGRRGPGQFNIHVFTRAGKHFVVSSALDVGPETLREMTQRCPTASVSDRVDPAQMARWRQSPATFTL